MASTPLDRICPHCASHALTFLEHGSGGTVFQCDGCKRAAVHSWEPVYKPVIKAAPPNEPFAFPSWYTGDERAR